MADKDSAAMVIGARVALLKPDQMAFGFGVLLSIADQNECVYAALAVAVLAAEQFTERPATFPAATIALSDQMEAEAARLKRERHRG